jgi:hypothetical protein
MITDDFTTGESKISQLSGRQRPRRLMLILPDLVVRVDQLSL